MLAIVRTVNNEWTEPLSRRETNAIKAEQQQLNGYDLASSIATTITTHY